MFKAYLSPELALGFAGCRWLSTFQCFCGHCSHYPRVQISPNEGKYASNCNLCQRWLLRRRFSVKIVHIAPKLQASVGHVETFRFQFLSSPNASRKNTREMGKVYAISGKTPRDIFFLHSRDLLFLVPVSWKTFLPFSEHVGRVYGTL